MTGERQPFGRRTVLKTLGIGLAVGATAVPASASSDKLAHELNEARKATQIYKDPGEAREDGHNLISPYVPQMGFHFENEEIIKEEILDKENDEIPITEPAILVYYPVGEYRNEIRDQLGEGVAPIFHDDDRDDELRLGAVEYAHEPDGAGDYFHDEEASRELQTTEEDGWAPFPGGYALHVWVHRNNPDGVFAPFNRTVL